MLSTVKSISLTGQSNISGKQVVFMAANITTEGSQAPTVNTTIMDKELYASNKAECRADIEAFTQEVYKVQDNIFGGAANEVK